MSAFELQADRSPVQGMFVKLASLKLAAQFGPCNLQNKAGVLLKLCAKILLSLMLLVAAPVAHADDFDDALEHFATDKFADTQDGIAALAASGSPLTLKVFDALASGHLVADTETAKVYIQADDDTVHDIRTDAVVPDIDADNLKKVRINNAVRRALDAAQGTLALLAPDKVKRLAAAEAVFQGRDAAALPSLDTAIGKERDEGVKRVMMQARAALVAPDAQAPEAARLVAITALKDRGDQDAQGLLASIAASSSGKVKTAAQAALTNIQSNLALLSSVQNIWYGLSLGSVLLLAAIGLAITFGVMGVINMAHGEMVMIGAYVTFGVQQAMQAYAPGLIQWSLLVAVPLSFVVTGFIGVLIERSIIRFLYGRPLETLLATFGLSLVLQQAIRTMFGANNRDVTAPAFMSGSFDFFGLSITSGRMWIIVFALIVFFVLQLVLRATSFGLRMRAVTQNRRMASAMGIDTNRIDALAFGLGSGIAGMAGVALSQIDNVSPNLGQSYIIDSFLVVVFGGVGNLWGTFVAALTLGVANKLLEPFVGAVLGKIVLLVFIILFIQKRPRGLFALKGRAVEA